MRYLKLIILLGIPLLVHADNLINSTGNDERPNYNPGELPIQHEFPKSGTNDDDSKAFDYPRTNEPETTNTNTLDRPPDYEELERSTENSATTESDEINVSRPSPFQPVPFPGDDGHGLASLPIEEPPSDLVPRDKIEGSEGSYTKKVYILFLGLSGAGKSSTLNFLFGNRNIAKIGISDPTSAKPMINEYVFSPTENPDTALHIIDTPGLGSPNGADHDNRLVSSLKSYLHNHADLNGTIPNLVLIFSRFDDNRMQGNKSRFVSMLRGYQLLKEQFTTSDDRPSNIVYVLTRFLSEIRSVKKKPGQKLGIFKDIIEEHTSFPKPIVITVADNSVIDEEDIDKDEDGNYKFPNKEWYPQNIIDKMVESCKNRSDNMCESVLKSVFKERSTIPYKLLEQQTTPPVQPIGVNPNLYAKTQFDIESTPVSLALAETYEKIDPTLRNSNPGSLEILQVGLQSKGIRNLDDVPKNDDKIILLLQGMNMNLAMVDTFERAFRVTVPRYPFNILTGNGYDVIDDAPIKNSPFDFEKLKFSQAGYMIPETMTLTLQDQSASIFNFYDNFDDMLSSRSRMLGISEHVHAEAEDRTMRPGENLINRWSKSAKKVSLTVVHETRTFQLMLNDNLNFKLAFREKVQLMPNFDSTSRNSVTAWKELFEEYGAYVVVSAYGGGIIETKLTVSGNELEKLRQKTFDPIRDIVQKLPQYSGTSNEFNNEWNAVNFEFLYLGGNPQYIEGNLHEISLNSTKRSLDKWKESLKTEPIMLENFIQLLPLSEYVKQIDPNIANEMEAARRALLTGDLKYVEPAEDEITTTTEDNPVPKFEEETGEVRHVQKQLDDLEKALNKSRQDREEAQQRILDLMRNKTKEAEGITLRPRPTTTRRTTTTTRRPTTTTRRTPFLPPTTEDPNRYNTHYNPPRSLYNCRRAEGCFQQTGYSYDIRNDTRLPHTPFQLAADALCKYLPDPQPNPYQPFYVYQNHESVQDYINYRQRKIVSNYELNRELYKGGMAKGHNVLNNRKHGTWLSIYIEFRLHENQIKCECSNLNEEFRRDVEALPLYYVKSCASVNKWKEFLNKYGTHFVNTTFVGGSIHIEAKGDFRKRILDTHLNTQEQRHEFFGKLNWANEDFEFHVHGGDENIFKSKSDFNNYNFQRYGTSLLTRGGTSLQSDLTLTTLEGPIAAVKHNLWDSFRQASNHYIHNALSPCGVRKYCSKWWYNTNECYNPQGKTCYWYEPNYQHYCVPNAGCNLEVYNARYGTCRCFQGTTLTADGFCV